MDKLKKTKNTNNRKKEVTNNKLSKKKIIKEKVKTIGKMLDEKLCVEGCFDIVLYCQDNKFFTQSNGQSVAKTPEGMFDLEMPNDLKLVDATIREYYGLNVKEDK